MAPHPPWIEADDTRLRELWGTGISTAAIGVEMNRSKGSIVGRAHRIDLDARPSPIMVRPSGPGSKPRTAKPPPLSKTTLRELACLKLPAMPHSEPPPVAPRPVIAAPPPPPVVVLFKPRPPCRCLWPMWGDNERTKFDAAGNPLLCGADAPDGTYCTEHQGVGFLRLKARARA